MDQSDNDWPELRSNIGKVRQVWGRLGIILRREGADHLTSLTFYRAVVQAVFLFRTETWVLSMAMYNRLDEVHMGFLQHMTWKRAKRISDRTWWQEGLDSIMKATGTQVVRTYIDMRQAAVDQWVSL